MRKARVERKTKETDIALELNLDGTGCYSIETGIGFFDHMLELLSKHSLIDLKIKAKGDLHVDEHHTVEDVGICLGAAVEKALGNKKGINRYGFSVLPFDETLALAAIDLSGRPYHVIDAEFKKSKVKDLRTEIVQDFFEAFAANAKCNLHLQILYGRNDHHKIEALFKAFARALRQAVAMDERAKNTLPSTKGRL